ncbi:MAG TPA: class I SAM-dependent methyltransferase [Acetobacteraceae bacterium]|jgi:cephalosporin hydroxylase|nr:class I SAM-dependent methyltransferase [Acetobacteraceae bacterium]
MKYMDSGYTHTNIAPELLDSTLLIIRPAFWLEIGSMLGGSAIRTAEAVNRASIPMQIVCIDPFCGDVNMWAWERPLAAGNAWRFLRVEDCRPTIYERFLANVLFQGHHDIILPIMTTSSVGLKLLSRLMQEQRLSVLPEVIYLDAAHEVDETFLEVRSSWALLPAGGVLLGDDWDWPAVRGDVLKFAEQITPNQALLDRFGAAHPDATRDGNVFLFRGQWLLAK